jgi:hypothetical protein
VFEKLGTNSQQTSVSIGADQLLSFGGCLRQMPYADLPLLIQHLQFLHKQGNVCVSNLFVSSGPSHHPFVSIGIPELISISKIEGLSVFFLLYM